MARVVFVLGHAGTGKGTYCTKIFEEFGFPHISIGNLLRKEVENNGDNSEFIKECIRTGDLVPKEITLKLLIDELKRFDDYTLVTIDGYPSSLCRMTLWNNTVGKPGCEFVLHLICPEEITTGRLLKRARSDDILKTIACRRATYEENILPVVKYYKEQGLVKEVSTNRSIDKVWMDLKDIFTPFKKIEK